MESFKKNNSGFSLVEVLIAITILAFISLSTVVMVDKNINTKDTVIEEDGAFMQTLTAINRIDADFNQLYTPLFNSVKAKNKSANTNAYDDNNHFSNLTFDGLTESNDIIPKIISEDKSTLIIFTQSNRRKFENSKESRYAWIKYKLISMPRDENNPDKEISGRFNLVRQVIATDIYNPQQDWDSVKEQLLLENIKELTFSFWDIRNKKFSTSLNDLGELKYVPRLIKTEIKWFDLNGNEKEIYKISRVINPYFDPSVDQKNKPNQSKTNSNNSQVSEEEFEEEFEDENE